MAENSKAPGTLRQIIIGGFTVSAMALCDIHFVKIQKPFIDIAPQKSETFRRPWWQNQDLLCISPINAIYYQVSIYQRKVTYDNLCTLYFVLSAPFFSYTFIYNN